MGEDIRFQRTKKRINETMLKLLQEKPFHKIRLTELCENAEINRTTFYKHYADIYAWREHYEDNCRNSIYYWMNTYTIEGLNNTIVDLLYMIEANQDFFRICTTKNFESTVWDDTMNGILTKMIAREVAEDAWKTEFLVSGTKGVMAKWISEGMKESREEVGNRIVEMIEKIG